MFEPPNEEAVAWLESGLGLSYHSKLGPTVRRQMFAFMPISDDWDGPASTEVQGLDDYRLDPFWNEQV